MFSRDLGIDLGTANTLIYVRGKGIVLNEPSVVAMDKTTKKVTHTGNDAKEMMGRTPGNIVALRPLKNGVVADFEAARAMLRYFILQARSVTRISRRPKVVVCVPTSVTEVEKRAVLEAVVMAGAPQNSVYLLEESKAAAIGAGLPINKPMGSMVVDIGGGTTEIAVFSLSTIVMGKSLSTAGDKLDEAVINYIKREYGVVVGDRSAEDLKKTMGYKIKSDDEKSEVRGRDLVTGLPRTLDISAYELNTALEEPIRNIIEGIRQTLERTPPELSSDIMKAGISLTGGSALLQGLGAALTKETGIPINIAPEPHYCVVNGTGKVLENLKAMREMLTTVKTIKL